MAVARAKLKAATALEQLADRCEKVTEQITKRVAGEPIKDRLVSLWDPDARPIRKGKLGKPNLCRDRDYAEKVLALSRPGFVGDSWPWRIKEGVHAKGANSWEAGHASVFA